MKGKSAYDLYADKDELGKMLTSLRREGSVKKWEMRVQRKDGSIVPFEISIGLLKDGQNKTLGSVCVARDLSGIKLALSALKASHERLYQEILERKQAEGTVERLRRRNELILNSAGEGILGLVRRGDIPLSILPLPGCWGIWPMNSSAGRAMTFTITPEKMEGRTLKRIVR